MQCTLIVFIIIVVVAAAAATVGVGVMAMQIACERHATSSSSYWLKRNPSFPSPHQAYAALPAHIKKPLGKQH